MKQSERPRRKIDYHEFHEPGEDEFPDLSHTASASELTGLTHRAPVNDQEWENLQELHPMEIPQKK